MEFDTVVTNFGEEGSVLTPDRGFADILLTLHFLGLAVLQEVGVG